MPKAPEPFDPEMLVHAGFAQHMLKHGRLVNGEEAAQFFQAAMPKAFVTDCDLRHVRPSAVPADNCEIPLVQMRPIWNDGLHRRVKS